MSDFNNQINKELIKNGFTLSDATYEFGKMGELWELSDSYGHGIYWRYVQSDLYSIKIEDYTYDKDMIINVKLPECMCISYFESISGEELHPYKRLEANCIKTYVSSNQTFKANIHKKIPIRSVSVEIYPKYYQEYLTNIYPGEYENLLEFFTYIDGSKEFSQFKLPFNQIKNYRGDGIAAKLFYSAKVSEIVSLMIEYKNNNKKIEKKKLSNDDREMLMSVTSYINDHYAFKITQSQLSKIACMGTTKLKTSFKLMHGCTITDYIQKRRMSQAEHLLTNTSLTIAQVAQTVGYTSSSRFTEIFKNSTGILPKEYRKITNT